MSELIKERLRESISKEVKIFLNNGWRYEGKLTNVDEEFCEILDYKTRAYKIIKLIDIKDCEVGA